MSIDQIYEAIRSLPVREQLRLVERVVHDVAASSRASGDPAPDLLGLFADDPELMASIGAEAVAERAGHEPRGEPRP